MPDIHQNLGSPHASPSHPPPPSSSPWLPLLQSRSTWVPSKFDTEITGNTNTTTTTTTINIAITGSTPLLLRSSSPRSAATLMRSTRDTASRPPQERLRGEEALGALQPPPRRVHELRGYVDRAGALRPLLGDRRRHGVSKKN
ncbi:hypothetical protein H6P81_013140 [Aristolochia fimbriata]|uniref:Uncharacterized protein n=1 Tax=Aristolochia fimbriata TaxID=158543 RepID=A0AAV7EHG3_ARIFI|nr:hypothetical protein H6P81_013140 [Aristolochia fimbriata]